MLDHRRAHLALFSAARVLAAILAVPLIAAANPSPPSRSTGAPGDSLCTRCHAGTANSGPGRVSIAFPAGSTYTPGAPQRLSVTVSDPDLARWAFQMTARLASNPSGSQGGAFTSISSLTQVTTAAPVQFIQTTSGGTQQGVRTSVTYQMDWTPPASNVGNIVFYVAGMAANGSGTAGDRVYTASATLTPASVPTTPAITVAPSSLAFNYVTAGSAPAAQNVSVGSSGTNFTFTTSTAGAAWLSASPASGTTPRAVSIAVNPVALAPGTYDGTVSIAATGVSNSPQTLAVRLTVSPATTPALTLSTSSLSYTYQAGGTAPAAQNVSVGSTGTNVNFTAAGAGGAWLSVSPASATTPRAVSVAVNPAGLAAGTYDGTVSIAATGVSNSPQTVAVRLTVSPTTPPVQAGGFKYDIVKIENTKPGQSPRVTFSVSDPTVGDARYDIESHPAFTQIASGASRLFVQIGWDTRDFVNTGSRSEFAPSGAAPAQPIAINALAGPVPNADGTYTVTSILPIPLSARGTGVVAIEGHPAGQDATGAWTVRVPVKSVYKSFIMTGDTRVERRRVVDNKKCTTCHGVLTLHGNNRTGEVQVCAMCHNPNATDVAYRRSTDGPETPIDFKVMIHSIHGAAKRTTPFVVIGRSHSVNDFSTVQYPGNLRDCRTCHREGTYLLPLKSKLGTTVNSQSITTLTLPVVNGDPSDDFKVTPTAATCSSCHDSQYARDHMVRNGASFSTLQQFITSGAVKERCSNCHGIGKEKDVAKVHAVK